LINFDERAKTWDDDPARIARAEAVAQGIRNAVSLTKHMTSFEYGCGTGLLSFALQPFLKHLTLADSSSGMLAVLQQKIAAQKADNIAFMKLDLTADAVPPERFDLVVTLMTLHHIPDTGKILRDFYLLLKCPGYLCVADLDKEDGSFHGPDFQGHKGFVRQDLMDMAGQAGFQNIRINTILTISKETGQGRKDFPLFLMAAEKI